MKKYLISIIFSAVIISIANAESNTYTSILEIVDKGRMGRLEKLAKEGKYLTDKGFNTIVLYDNISAKLLKAHKEGKKEDVAKHFKALKRIMRDLLSNKPRDFERVGLNIDLIKDFDAMPVRLDTEFQRKWDSAFEK